MKEVNKEIITNRFKSFAWRSGMMVLALLLNTITASLSDFNLSPEVVVVLGLVLGEISKAINQKLS